MTLLAFAAECCAVASAAAPLVVYAWRSAANLPHVGAAVAYDGTDRRTDTRSCHLYTMRAMSCMMWQNYFPLPPPWHIVIPAWIPLPPSSVMSFMGVLLYTHNLLYMVRYFRPFTSIFTLLQYDSSLMSDLENLSSIAHSRDDYICKVSFKSVISPLSMDPSLTQTVLMDSRPWLVGLTRKQMTFAACMFILQFQCT